MEISIDTRMRMAEFLANFKHNDRFKTTAQEEEAYELIKEVYSKLN